MKNKILIITILISSIGIFLFLVSKVEYSYKEGQLYSQNDLPGYNETQDENSNLINRNKAIKIATYILSDVLEVDMTDKNPIMNVEIYRENDKNVTYNWNIWWSKEDYDGNYGVILNSRTGEILNVYVNNIFPIKNNNVSAELGKKEIRDIVKPFTDSIGINLQNYTMKVTSKSEYNVLGQKTPYKYCLFKNKNNEKFSITIDSKAEKIVEYKRNP